MSHELILFFNFIKMPKILGAYPCSYCEGNTDNACTSCDFECNCVEILDENEKEGELNEKEEFFQKQIDKYL